MSIERGSDRGGDGRRHDEGPPPPGVPTDAAAARALVRNLLDEQFCGGIGADDVIMSDAMLVTSELVTNAIRHGGGLTGFRAELTSEGLVLNVADANPAAPRTISAAPDTVRVGGYGWPLIRRLAKDVTITPLASGKSIDVLVALF